VGESRALTIVRCATIRNVAVGLAACTLLLAGCRAHEGTFRPACIAFEGHVVEFENGRFEWSRFTDERIVNDAGRVIEPFPNYPKTGRYERDGNKLSLTEDSGESLDDWYLLQHDGDLYLLTYEEHEAFLGEKFLDNCSLKLSNDR